jgi:serine/threonine-protein kinase
MPHPSSTAREPRRLEPQNRIAGKYQLKRRIAIGGMGEVWVARNEATSADVALKVLRRNSDTSIQAAARFRHEARLGAMLSHRSIVRIFDLVEEEDGALVLVMELLRGETLHAFLERSGPQSAKEAVAIITPILSALSHAHAHGIVHRDVTPANIFLAVDPDGQVTPKLVDFGIAKVASPEASSGRPAAQAAFRIDAADVPKSGVQTVDGRVLGTPRYMSPEQVRMQADIDARSDLFSVGVVLYEIISGVSPFAAPTPAGSLAAVLEAHVDPDPRIDPKVWLEIQRALSKRAYERHASADELATALRAAVGETDASLGASLRRTHPPPRWDDEAAPVPVTLSEFQTKSIEGQSVAFGLPRRRAAWVPWAIGGVVLVVGLVVALTFGALRGSSTSAASAASQNTASNAPSHSSAAIEPPATPSASAAPSTSAASVKPTRPSTTPVNAPRTTSTPAATKSKPIATTAGF